MLELIGRAREQLGRQPIYELRYTKVLGWSDKLPPGLYCKTNFRAEEFEERPALREAHRQVLEGQLREMSALREGYALNVVTSEHTTPEGFAILRINIVGK